jgi:hypothetical protein
MVVAMSNACHPRADGDSQYLTPSSLFTAFSTKLKCLESEDLKRESVINSYIFRATPGIILNRHNKNNRGAKNKSNAEGSGTFV